MSKNSEKALMYSIGCGDVRAMKHLMDKYLDLVSRISFRILCDRKDSEAVVQDVFLHVWKYSETFESGMNLEHWLLHHTCRYARMRIVRRRLMYIFGQRPDLYVTTAPKAPAYDDFITQQAWELYCRISVEFNITQRILFSLCTLEGIHENDASLITGVSRRRITSLLADAESKFRKELGNFGKQEEYQSYVGFLRKVAEGYTEHDSLKRIIMASVH